MKVNSHKAHKPVISSREAAEQSADLTQLQMDGDKVYWLETQPEKGGRITLMEHHNGKTRDLLPLAYNIKSRVYEYGGGAYAVESGTVVFINDSDQGLYSMNLNDGRIEALTTELASTRFGDLNLDMPGRRVLCVRERLQEKEQAIVDLVSIDLNHPGEIQVLHQGQDFYSSPRISPDGKTICWLSWNHPHMPWDETVLWVATPGSGGGIESLRRFAFKGVSLLQPRWSPDNRLYLITDLDNWWNIHRLDGNQLRPMMKKPFEFARPPWVFGLSTYAFISAETMLCSYNDNGNWVLCSLHADSGKLSELSRDFAQVTHLQADAHRACFIGAHQDTGPDIHCWRRHDKTIAPLDSSKVQRLPDHLFTAPQAMTYTTKEGETVYALFYRPEQPLTEPPPLLVVAHGGPTSQSECALDIRIQFWTSRGFAVCAVNYAGSSGYGRTYRKRLVGKWGIADVEDCGEAVQELGRRGEIDPNRVAIRGNSAGGYTVLNALCSAEAFSAGVSYYGISNITRLYHETHKFESRYIDSLIGPWPESEALYRQRSPINRCAEINRPALFLQGGKDRIVPPNQARQMYQALLEKGLTTELVVFEDEYHGFRAANNIAQALERELLFYQRVLNIPHLTIGDHD